jgi:hypothetical protein
MNRWIEILGWIGSIEVIAAYALNSYQKIKSDSAVFQLLNLTGAMFLIINSLYKSAFQFTLINTVWAAVAVIALVRIGKKKPTDR